MAPRLSGTRKRGIPKTTSPAGALAEAAPEAPATGRHDVASQEMRVPRRS